MIESSGLFCWTGICHENRIEVEKKKIFNRFLTMSVLNHPKTRCPFFKLKVPQFKKKLNLKKLNKIFLWILLTDVGAKKMSKIKHTNVM
jgi:hypothetical protein